ncbi:phosphatidylinositol 3-kinase catalytic subunit type 3 [Melitaea cinxia]|uniref:phosphatidylinositol 3-kinase catalytic subunit type 3 n=1 Tax=Melitaea cinxia TaxID=113334 RepID=UPI001E271FD8|nr:phosphatidylinositol 3-kinase catalytic subunit type 3 [Melitaea cinxia]
MDEIDDKFYYVFSSSLDHKVQIKIGTLEGTRPKPEYDQLLQDPMLKFSGLYQDGCSDLYVKCQILSDGVPVSLPVMTSYKPFTNRWNWNEWVTLPVYFSDLPRNAILAMSIYDCAGPAQVLVVGGTTISLFGKHGMLRQGMFDLRVWPGMEGSEKTPGKAPDKGEEQMQRLAKLAKKHRNGHIPKVDWLDRLTFREIEMINEKEKRNSNYMYLMIEFPTVHINDINHAVVYYEHEGDETCQLREADVVTVPDYEILQENLVESKHHRLARSLRSAEPGRDVKPSAAERDRLGAVMAAPAAFLQLSADDQDLLWKYRYYLSTDRRGLAKFLTCINWNRPGEVKQAVSMMYQWEPMAVEDALELLTPKFTHPAVRKYAMSRVSEAPDEDLLLYLLQLVQALKYENFEEIHYECAKICGKDVTMYTTQGKLLQTAIQKGSQAAGTSGVLTPNEMTSLPVRRASDAEEVEVVESTATKNDESYILRNGSDSFSEPSLALFLVRRACENPVVANYLYWYLLVECEDEAGGRAPDLGTRHMYLAAMRMLSHLLASGNAVQQRTRSFLARQQVFIDKLVKLVKTVARESGNRNKKAERLQQLLSDPDAFKFNFTNFEPMPFPLDPSVHIKGIVAKKASLFKSALMPCKLTFLTSEGSEYEAIFKHGDDLRQDQLILQMITLMDKVLRRDNLDLKLTPYRVLATSSRHGFLQFIESVTVAEALATEGTIQNFLRKYNPGDGPFGIKQETMDTYIRSCAGYCIITYLLGVGDRHLDNLLLTKSGALFHIDFGYILGRDPKPLPPPMKLSREMVEAMGGVADPLYQEFRTLCYTTFQNLRRHANLILNLFSLMVDASVPDIALEPEKAVQKVMMNLRLDLGEEEAIQHVQNLLDVSVSAVMAALVEQLHKFAQYWRK